MKINFTYEIFILHMELKQVTREISFSYVKLHVKFWKGIQWMMYEDSQIEIRRGKGWKVKTKRGKDDEKSKGKVVVGRKRRNERGQKVVKWKWEKMREDRKERLVVIQIRKIKKELEGKETNKLNKKNQRRKLSGIETQVWNENKNIEVKGTQET